MSDESMSEMVVSYITDLGLALIPLKRRSKEPVTNHGLKDWTDDAEFAKKEFEQHPNWNVAAVLGEPSKGVIVIDIDYDEEKGYDGYDTLREWEKEHGELPETVTAITGRDGLHMYYRASRPIRPSVNDELHVDIRGEGSYAMLPPSVHPNGQRMFWENHPDDFEIADADENVYAFIEHVRPQVVSEYDKFELPKVIEEGSRDNTLYQYGCSLRAKCVSPENIASALMDANAARCKPPLPESEVKKKIESVLKLPAGLSKEAMEAQGIKVDEKATKPTESKPSAPKFNHAKFADEMIREDHVCIIDGAIAIYQDGCYRMGRRAVESGMIKRKHNIRSSERNEVLKYLEIEAPEKKMANKRYIAFNNCVLDILTDETFEMSPEWIIPNIIPHNWNPEACDEFVQNTITKIANYDPPTLQNLFEVIGYSMYRGTELATCPILFGVGQNGKSTFLNMLHKILGDENVSSLDVGTVGERFQTIPLMGKLANIGDDISNDFVSGTKASVVKKIITGDWVQAEYKGGDTFSFKPYCSLIFSCNEFPRLGDSSEGMMRRLLPIKFAAKFSTSDPDFDPYIEDKLSTEPACEAAIYFGIIALQGCLKNKAFTRSEVSYEEIENIKLSNSTVYQYAVDELDYSTDTPLNIMHRATNSVFTDYLDYCENMRIRTPVHQPKFSIEMKRLFNCDIGLEYIETARGKKRARCFVPRN